MLVTEHQAQVKVCPCCRKRSRSAFPTRVKSPAQYGSNVLAHAAYLNSYHLIPVARVREWFADCVGQAVSEGTIERVLKQFADAVAPSLDVIYAGVTRSAVVHRVPGQHGLALAAHGLHRAVELLQRPFEAWQ